MASNAQLADLEEALGYSFHDGSLLVDALTHSSYVAENPGAESYERLELLGDAVLGLFTTKSLFDRMPDEPEGSITKVRALVVSETALARIARSLDLGAFLRLGVGEARSGGAERDSILSDVVESILGAVLLDGGTSAAEAVVDRLFEPAIAVAIERPDTTDSRSRLQEILAADGRVATFEYDRTGPDHAARFTASVIVDGQVLGTGSGGSKKAAAIAASADALSRTTFV